MSAPALAILVCVAEVLGMLNFSTFQALIPTFQADWKLSNTDAGWISGIFFAGYVAAVPVLVSLTDRIDPRRITLVALVVGGLSSLGFALFAEGFWTAMIFRALQGIGLAGTYMPGLKALSDQTEGAHQSRYVAFYTASFGIGAGLSYPLAGEMTAAFDWHWAFGANAIGSVAAFILIWWGLPAKAPEHHEHHGHLLNFRPIFENRRAMAFILGYMGHNWELFAFRSWVVAFMVFVERSHGIDSPIVTATGLAAIATLLGVPSSIIGNELAVRLGRPRLILIVTGVSVALGCVLGFTSASSYWLAALMCLVYGFLLTSDSAALTAGTVAAAAPGQRGQTLAMHAFLGFMGGVFGPLAMGIALDAIGNGIAADWGLAFATGAVGSAIAFAAVAFRRE